MDQDTPLKIIVAHNLAELRKNKGLTQIQLAEKFGYSDKSISKWEHGEALPDIETLAALCDYYGVTLDYLTHIVSDEDKKSYESPHKEERVNRLVITLLSCLIPPIVAITLYIGLEIALHIQYWVAFIWMIAVDFLLAFIFNCIWGPKRFWRPALAIGLVWSSITALYLQVGTTVPDGLGWNLWMLFIAGIPLTIASLLWNHVKS